MRKTKQTTVPQVPQSNHYPRRFADAFRGYASVGERREPLRFVEPTGFHAKGVIESRAIIFPSDGRGKLDELFTTEVRFKDLEILVRYSNGCFGHLRCVLQDRLFELAEVITCRIVIDLGNVLLGEPTTPSANGRHDVHSERALYKFCGP